MATTFVANGLLAPCDLASTATSASSSFQSNLNGLLSGSLLLPAPGKICLDEGSLLDLKQTKVIFTRNGLLERGSEALRSPSFPIAPSLAPPVPEGSNNAFVSNGLLEISAPPTIEAEGIVPPQLVGKAAEGTTDDDLPSISNLFGIPTVLSANACVPSVSSLSQPPILPIRATTFDGKAVFLRKRIKSRNSMQKYPTSSSTHKMGNLLDVPIHRLMEGLSTSKASDIEREEQNSYQQKSETKTKTRVEDELWVDRYRPRKFTELMGNDRVARETMAWLKEWDWCVFGRKKGKKRARDDDENAVYEDEHHRPREKFLLLSGPPGLGKTTLAHVVARQAGYDVLEINASDARSGQIVDDRIRPTLEAGSTLGSTKPVLLIIDEIDGATGAGESSNTFIHKLVSLVHDKPQKKQRNGKRDPNAKRPILRPIICICNDLNASSIAKLRPHALQLRFNRPSDIHTVKRLREVCGFEGIKADSRALSTLVAIAQGDLRGCLNTLQFIKSRSEDVTETVIRKATSGMKEAESSIQTVLNSLFSPLSKKRVKELGLTELEETRYVARLCQEIDACGREGGIAIGCFGHYATLREHDASLSRHENAIGWLTTFDLLSASMYSDGDFTLSQYLPYTLVAFFPLFQERGAQRVERSQADWEHLQLSRSNEEIYKSLARCLRTATTRHGGDFRHLLSTPILQLEFAPLINRIISPPLRPVNSQVIRAHEKALLNRLVHIMASVELRFVQERNEDGQLSYRLDPPIDVFVTYDGKRATDIAISRYAVRHLVAGEVDTKLIERDADAVEKGRRGKHELFGQSTHLKSGGTEVNSKRTKNDVGETNEHPNKRAKIDIADQPPTDFFGRLINVPSASDTTSVPLKPVEKKYRVSYRFAEGNSAAVRKPVKMGLFL